MSLLDADIHSAHPSVIIDADAMFSEDISYFGYPSFRRSSLSRLGSSRGNFAPFFFVISSLLWKKLVIVHTGGLDSDLMQK